MDAIEFRKLLVKLGACEDARVWAKGKTLAETWDSCERADWLLWLAGKMHGQPGWPTRQEIVVVACDCAELALAHVKAGEERPRIAIETARKWARGEATIEQVREARQAAAAYAAAAAYDDDAAAAYDDAAAAYAAAAAAYAAAADAAYAAYAAAYAAYAAAYAARTKVRAQCLDIVRKGLSIPK